MDGAGLPDDLSSELPPGPGEKGIVARVMRKHSGEVRTRGVPTDKEALGEVCIEEDRVLYDLEYARNDEERVCAEVGVNLPI